MKAVIDNDILFKGACYGLLADLVSIDSPDGSVVGILGAAHFIVPKRIGRTDLSRGRAMALEDFSRFLRKAKTLEPTEEEQVMAADLELVAQKLSISLDNGESQLCAILVCRFFPLLLTGDKRAIVAMEKLLDHDSRLIQICGKVKCLEQLFAILLARDGSSSLRSSVCGEPHIDKALTSCFSCHSSSVPEASHLEGLQSYISHLRSLTPRVLSP